jgi:hypothetical protein
MTTLLPISDATLPGWDTSEMLSRRQVVVGLGSFLILLPTSAWLSCGGSSGTGGDAVLTFTSSTDDGHSHIYQIT